MATNGTDGVKNKVDGNSGESHHPRSRRQRAGYTTDLRPSSIQEEAEADPKQNEESSMPTARKHHGPSKQS